MTYRSGPSSDAPTTSGGGGRAGRLAIRTTSEGRDFRQWNCEPFHLKSASFAEFGDRASSVAYPFRRNNPCRRVSEYRDRLHYLPFPSPTYSACRPASRKVALSTLGIALYRVIVVQCVY